MSIKIDIISGFLGAGKTTLIKKIFEAGFNGQRVVLIENEFGEIGIDGTFLKEAGVDIKEINSGCICCSLVGDFSKSMEEVVNKFNPERIIIEPSGVGKLSDIIKAVEELNIDLELNIVATVVDGGKCKIYMKNFGEFFNNQVEDAKTIIVSKVEKLSDEKILETYNLLKAKNPNANIILANLTIVDAEKLVETLKGEIPNGMIESRTESLIQDFEMRLQQQGMPLDMYMKYTGLTIEAMKQQFKPQAEMAVKSTLVLEKVAQLEKIEVKDKDVEAKFEEMAKAYNMEVDKIKELLREEDKENIKKDLVIEKAVKVILDNAVMVKEEKKPAAKKTTAKAEEKKPAAKKTTKKAAEDKEEKAPAKKTAAKKTTTKKAAKTEE